LNPGIRRRIRKGIRDPAAISRFLRGGRSGVVSLYQERFAKALGMGDEFSEYLQEPSQDEDFAAHLRDPAVRKALLYGPGTIPLPFAEVLYALCRYARPAIVVETGVGSGFSSAFILLALKRNGTGLLHSVDFPNAVYRADHREVEDTLPSKEVPGWFVPEALRQPWTLHIGRTREVLEPLLADLDRVDLFLRDSEHVYSTMMFEFQAAWRRMPSGALLLSDNSNVNTAFVDFCRKVHAARTARFLEVSAAVKD
jgi:hypothetical protein